jgi:hypothetical protein
VSDIVPAALANAGAQPAAPSVPVALLEEAIADCPDVTMSDEDHGMKVVANRIQRLIDAAKKGGG